MAKNISGKTGATTVTGIAGGAGIAPLIIWILGQAGVDMPPEVAVIVGGLIASTFAFVTAWLVPATSGKHVDTTPWVHEPAPGSEEADEVDWSDGEQGGMAGYSSVEIPELEEN